MKYENACEFYNKADYEGGLAELVLGYGVSKADVPPKVAITIGFLERAYERFHAAVKEWHGENCANPEERCAR